jgi:hypothetical protein
VTHSGLGGGGSVYERQMSGYAAPPTTISPSTIGGGMHTARSSMAGGVDFRRCAGLPPQSRSC